MISPTTRLIAVNGSAGAWVEIPVTIACTYMEIKEDDVATRQGLQVKFATDNFTAIKTVASTEADPIAIGSKRMHGSGNSPLLGLPAQKDCYGNSITAKVVAKVLSKTATGTNVWVSEWS